jgi:hypothetical protein
MGGGGAVATIAAGPGVAGLGRTTTFPPPQATNNAPAAETIRRANILKFDFIVVFS